MTEEKISTRHGISWIGFSQAGKVVMQLVSVFTLSRILPAEDFGLMALAATATAFAGLLRDMGTGSALIQKQELSSDLKNAVFSFNILLGVLLTFIIMIASPLLAILFKEPRIVNILLVLAPVFAVSSIGSVHQALLERDLLFQHLAKIELTSNFSGLLSALVVAWLGGGVYALIVQGIGTAFVGSILLWTISTWRPRFEFKLAPLKKIWRFSGNIFIFNLLNYFHRNSDSLLIGRFLGMRDLGYYDTAYRILLFPLQNFTFIVNRAMFPAYSRFQHDHDLIGIHYLGLLEILSFITAPLMALIWALREPLVIIFLGERWLPAAYVLAWLAPVGFFQSLVSTSGSVLNSIGRSDILRNLGMIGAPFLTLSFVLGLPWGIKGVAAAYCIANFFWIYPVIGTVLKLLSCSFLRFLVAIVKPAFIAAFAAIFVRSLDINIFLKLEIPFVHLLIGTIIGLTIYLILAWILIPKTVFRFLWVLRNNGS